MGVFFVLGLVISRLPDNIAYVHGKALAALYSQLEGRVLHAVKGRIAFALSLALVSITKGNTGTSIN
jgi:hypothetical protein